MCRVQGTGGSPKPMVAKTHRCPKLHVISRKRATNDKALLRKMTYNDTASCGSSPPCSTRETRI